MNTHTPATGFKFWPFVASLLITLSIGFIASLFTRPEIPGWYAGLTKPSFTPPNWAFPLAWTTLYILIGLAAYLVWQRRENSETYKHTSAVYAVQLLFNFWWSIIFFGLHQMLFAFGIIVLLWISIVVNMVYFNRFSKVACWLLLPYLLWVSFAGVLNFSIYLLNR